MNYPVICRKLIELQIVSAEQCENFTEADIAQAIEGVHQALTIVAKNLEIVTAENKRASKTAQSIHSLDISSLVQAQRHAIEEIRDQYPTLSFIQAFAKAKHDSPGLFEQETITVEA
jgi:hypothetical protein